MSSKGADTELILISEAVARLEAGMYGVIERPESVQAAKKTYPGASIGCGPQKEDAAKRICEAIMQGKLSVFVLPDLAEGEVLQVPVDLLKQMMKTRGGLPDQAIAAARIFANARIFAKEPIAPALFDGLAKSELHIRRKEFEAWYEEARERHNWPSQYKSRKPRKDGSFKPSIGRPSKQNHLRNPIIALVNEGRWSARQYSIADLVRHLKSGRRSASRQTVERTVAQLHRETGDPRYYYEDPRKKPDDSVWNLKTWPIDGPPSIENDQKS
jgi:hypothetical protein